MPARALRNVARLLRPNGAFAVLSYEPPAGRSAFFEAPELGFRRREPPRSIEDGRGNTLFVLEKAAEVAGTRVGLADNHRDKDT